MTNKKKVILLGSTLIVALGCCVYAASGDKSTFSHHFKIDKDFKAKFSSTQEVKDVETSGDRMEKKRGCRGSKFPKTFNKEDFENLSEEEREALKEKREEMKEERANKKEARKELSDEEKEALKEKREEMKKEALKELTEEEKENLKEFKFKRKGFRNKNSKENED